MATQSETGTSGDRPFVISRTFDAPRALVWKAWTETEHLMKWFGPKGFTMPFAKNDLRPGGVFHYGMRSPDGHEMWGKWTYREIVEPERLVVVVSFSDEKGGVTRHPMAPDWPLETLSTTTFTEQDGKTTVTVEWSALGGTEKERRTFDAGHDSMRQGWGGTMDQLDEYLKQLPKRTDMAETNPPIIPYLIVAGGVAAIEFYKKAFGAEELFRLPTPDGRIMHARLRLNGGTLMLSDDMPDQCGGVSSAPKGPGAPVTIHLTVPDIDASFGKAVDAGATAEMPPTDMFWGDRYARLKDPFGHSWSLSTPKRQVSPEELKAAVEGFSKARA